MTYEKNIPTLLLNVSLSIIEYSNDSIVKISSKQVPNKLLKQLELILLQCVVTSPILVS